MSGDLFDDPPFALEPPAPRSVVPIEPLFSLLCEAPLPALEHLYRTLLDFKRDTALDEPIPEVGLSRRRYLEQVMLVRSLRGLG